MMTTVAGTPISEEDFVEKHRKAMTDALRMEKERSFNAIMQAAKQRCWEIG